MLELGVRGRHFLAATLLVCGCASPAQDKSTGTNWLKCTTDVDCAPASDAVVCDQGYCVDSKGTRVDVTENETPPFSIRLTGQALSVALEPSTHLYYLTCSLLLGIDKLTAGGWAPLENDLGDYYQVLKSEPYGYMLDGQYNHAPGAGCDSATCADLVDGTDAGSVTEIVQVSSVSPPPGITAPSDPPPSTIDAFESRPLQTTDVRAQIQYFVDQSCRTSRWVTLEVDVP